MVGGLALAALSSGNIVGVAGAAHAADSAQGPVNGPIVYAGKDTVYHAVNPDGSGNVLAPLQQQGAPVYQPQYSPDGSRVLYADINGCWYVADADGTNALALSLQNPAQPYHASCEGMLSAYHARPAPVSVSFVSAAWSADGRNLFLLDRSGAINTLSADGTRVTRFGAGLPAASTLLSVAPNGAIAFRGPQSPDNISILDPGASAPRALTVGYEAKFSAADGRLLVRDLVLPNGMHSGDLVSTLFLVDPGSGARTAVTDAWTEFVSDFAWSPDGKQVAYTTVWGQVDTVYTRPVDGGPRVVVVQNAAAPHLAGWHNGPFPVARAADRIGGADRIETAVAASRWSYGRTGTGTGGRQAAVAVISRSDQFADALGGSALAAQKGGPLLLTATGGLDARVRDELKRVLAPGSKVYVLGGTAALSPAVEAQIKALGFGTERLAGADRFSTSVAVARAVSPNPHTVMVATGMKFPDALAAGAAAAQDAKGGVVVLSNEAALPDSVRGYLAGVNPGVADVYGVGVQGVAALRGVFPQPGANAKVTPLSGADRFATAAAVASSKLFAAGAPVARIGLATGMSWPDALSGGALIATQHGPLLLTDPSSQYLPRPELDVVKALSPHLAGVVVFGGYQAVGTVAANTAQTALGQNRYKDYNNRETPVLGGAR
ncbi:hypothetical protein GCM10009839_42790 [Catenulispora yoronensis]|uniref:Cell wall-binding repeat-containing protein n=1 Tax=Catenulispora yoronensis TaxID=450799 RepID=A0ABP5FZ23_9ACTN